ncbi:MAG TPA: hypothetical protein VIL19_08230, partial [Casimicrobiaceae bacterium]
MWGQRLSQAPRFIFGVQMTAATTNKTYPVIVIVLVLVIAAMVYKFIVSGSTEKAADGRVSVVLAPGERALVLREMRDFVAGIQ